VSGLGHLLVVGGDTNERKHVGNDNRGLHLQDLRLAVQDDQRAGPGLLTPRVETKKGAGHVLTVEVNAGNIVRYEWIDDATRDVLLTEHVEFDNVTADDALTCMACHTISMARDIVG
jgi:hypothetical protein